MSNSPMSGIAGYPAGAGASTSMDCAKIQRRDELRSELAVLLEARRRLEEIIRHDAGGQLVPGAGGAAAVDASSATADNDFYRLDDDDDEEEELEQRPMQWQDQVCRQMVYNSSRQQRDDLVGGHLAADFSDNHDLDLDDGGDEISRDIVALGLHVPHIIQQPATTTTTAHRGGGGGGFGAVPSSAAAIAGLKKHRYDGQSSGGGDGMCVICMREYKKGRRLRVMPCAHKHRFHGRCIRKWLAQSNLCPLCRHALPTADGAEQGEAAAATAAGVHRRVLVRVNANPY